MIIKLSSEGSESIDDFICSPESGVNIEETSLDSFLRSIVDAPHTLLTVAHGAILQSALCAYLSLIALAGLAINAIWHIKWADPLAALAVLPLIVWEGREAMRGKTCGCC